MAITTILSSPVTIFLALCGAILMLELERRWTRTRRLAGKSAGPLAFMLDGAAIFSMMLTIVGAVLAAVNGVMALIAAFTAWLRAMNETFYAVSWLPAVAGGMTAGALLTLIVVLVIVRRSRHVRQLAALDGREGDGGTPDEALVAASSGQPALTAAAAPLAALARANVAARPMAAAEVSGSIASVPTAGVSTGAQVGASTVPPPAPRVYREPAQAAAPPPVTPPPAAPPISAISSASVSAQDDAEPSLVMLRGRRTPQAVAAPEPESFLPATPPPVAQPRRFNWTPAVLLVLLIAGALGYIYREPALAFVASLPVSEPGSTSVVLAQSTIAPTPLPPEPTAAPQIFRVASDRLNLRAGPGVDQAIIATLLRDTEVEFLGETSGSGDETWVKVRAEEYEGWVYRAFLQ